MKAAVENGADALHFGLERWNARERAQNFKLADLPQVVRGLHRRGVKGYVTFNTLIYESELEPAEDMLRAISAAGADAIIVQDLGAVRLARETAPGLPVHASTQMTITDAASAELARSLGIERAVLAQVRNIAGAETSRAERPLPRFPRWRRPVSSSRCSSSCSVAASRGKGRGARSTATAKAT
jgi:putative protease